MSHSLRLKSLQPQDLLACLEPYWQVRRWLVAYSGGVDSHVLLHLMSQLYQLTDLPVDKLPELLAVHINHQLQPEAIQWSEHCEQQAFELGVSLSVHCVDVHCSTRESIEDKARQARYQCLESITKPGDLVLMGHHLDDQVETVLLRLLRGSGTRGLAAMPHSRRLGEAQLLRPLLDCGRQEIEHYAREHNLSWVEDPSNQRSDYDRNFLRLQILPRLAQRWPNYRHTVGRAALFNEESNTLNTQLAQLDFDRLGLSPANKSLPISALSHLSVARKKNLIRYWLISRGLALPTAAQLQSVLDQVIGAKRHAKPVVSWSIGKEKGKKSHSTVEIRRFRDELYAMQSLPDFDSQAVYHWNTDQMLHIEGVGDLITQPVVGKGLKTHNPLIVQLRKGGERCRPSGRVGSQTLKKLFQEYDVPTWLRDRIPLIYIGGILAAVGDLWICDGFTAAMDEPGLVLTWRKP